MMILKSTGVSRRIDELGRVVIPKEIRKSLKLNEGTLLEFYIGDDNNLVLKKYSPLYSISTYANEIVTSLAELIGFPCLIADTEKIIACANISKKIFLEKPLNIRMLKIMEQKKLRYIEANGEMMTEYIEDTPIQGIIISPVIKDGDLLGAVIIFNKESNLSLGNVEERLAKLTSCYLEKL